MMKKWFITSCLIVATQFFFQCTSNEGEQAATAWQEINGRDEGVASQIDRTPIYRVKVPTHWTRKDPEKELSIQDTTKSLCEFYIHENNESIRITVHNFPTNNIEERIPPGAQISRWKRQFEHLDPTSVSIVPKAYGGFSGFLFEGTGTKEGSPITMLGWSMQLAPELYRQLSLSQSVYQTPQYTQMRADYTIKAIGSPEKVARHKKAIRDFAHSFELIQPIPMRS